MVLGIIFFLVLVFMLIYLITKGKEFKQMVFFFLFPVVMIGFPGIKKISYDNGKIEIERETSKLLANPNDKAVRENLSVKVRNFESRASKDPTALVSLANANIALGDTAKARESVKKAVKINPKMILSKELVNRMHGR